MGTSDSEDTFGWGVIKNEWEIFVRELVSEARARSLTIR